MLNEELAAGDACLSGPGKISMVCVGLPWDPIGLPSPYGPFPNEMDPNLKGGGAGNHITTKWISICPSFGPNANGQKK